MTIDENWLRKNRLLRCHNNEELYLKKLNELKQLYDLAFNNRSLDIRPLFFDSHQAIISQIEESKAILCDVHFIDIAALVATSFYVNPTHDIRKLTNALLADNCICHDDISTALEYARKFIRKPYNAAFSIDGDEIIRNNLFYSRRLQTTFALLHELSHFEYSQSKFTPLYQEYFIDAIRSHNKVARLINSINLQPLASYLDKIDILSEYAYPTPHNYQQIVTQAMNEMFAVITEYGYLVEVRTQDPNERNQMLAYACDNYIRKKTSAILDQDRLVEECTCDMIAIGELLEFQIPELSKMDSLKQAITSFYLCILTQNFIQTASEMRKYQNSRANQHVDEIYMRKRLVRGAIGILIATYIDSSSDYVEIIEYSDKVSQITDIMYAEFSEHIGNISFKEDENKYIPFGSDEWQFYYSEIERLLQYPV